MSGYARRVLGFMVVLGAVLVLRWSVFRVAWDSSAVDAWIATRFVVTGLVCGAFLLVRDRWKRTRGRAPAGDDLHEARARTRHRGRRSAGAVRDLSGNVLAL